MDATQLLGRLSHAVLDMDLAGVEDLVSPCLTAIYEDARVHHPAALRIVVPRRLAILFEPGEAEGLFTVEAV